MRKRAGRSEQEPAHIMGSGETAKNLPGKLVSFQQFH